MGLVTLDLRPSELGFEPDSHQKVHPPGSIAKLVGLPTVIEPDPSLVNGHFLESLIRQRSPLSHAQLGRIIEDRRIDLTIEGFENGIVPASSNPLSSYWKHFWTRDGAITAYAVRACALKWTGQEEFAQKMITQMCSYYNGPVQRDRIISFHHLSREEARAAYANGINRPCIRAPIDRENDGEPCHELFGPNGELVSHADHWHHAQIDALSMWVWTAFRFANQEVVDLGVLNSFLDFQNSDNQHESILSAGLKFLMKIDPIFQRDVGMWEEHEREVEGRTSSVMIYQAALREALQFFTTNPGVCKVNYGLSTSDDSILIQELKAEIERVGEHLAFRIPVDGEARESDDPHVIRDAALIVGLYPFDAGLSSEQENSILRAIYPLMGAGFMRYPGDAYVGQDYVSSVLPYSMADTSVQGYREAQWGLFDPILAAYFYRRFANGGLEEDLLRADAHLKRSLSLITSEDDDVEGQFEVEAGSPVEAYFWDSKQERWRANGNSPLNWTKAALALALERGRFATASL